MSKSSYLIKNMGILTISNFSSKILVFLLVPLYTSVLSTKEYGTYDLAVSTATLLYPILTLNIVDAVMRFLMDKESDKKAIASIGLKYVSISSVLFGFIMLFFYITGIWSDINGLEGYIFSYYISYVINQFFIQFAKGLEKVKNMSNALSQEFIRMTYGKREIVVDGTISGMGRGAGNTPTELIAQYLVSQREYNYDIDAILDLIDDYMDNIRTKCSWGYSTPYFIAGCYGAHVNNIAYLTQKNSIRSKDIRYILNKIGAIPRKRYDYNLLEKTYVDYLM